MKRKIALKHSLFALCLVVFGGATAFAANNSNFSQVISTGSLSTDIMDASRVAVTNPSIAMSAKTFSFDCQAGGTASTGTFGSDTERIYVNNPDGADNGWNLTIAATGGETSLWQNGGSTQNFDFNDPTGTTAGCTDPGAGLDADTRPGQLSLNPAAGNITTDCGTCAATGVTLGSSASFNQGTTDNITLVSAGAGSNDIWRGYFKAIAASQTIPAEQPADTYTLNLTMTSAAL